MIKIKEENSMLETLLFFLGLVIGIAAGIIFMRVKPIFGLKRQEQKSKNCLKKQKLDLIRLFEMHN